MHIYMCMCMYIHMNVLDLGLIYPWSKACFLNIHIYIYIRTYICTKTYTHT